MARGKAGGLAVREKYGLAWLRQRASNGGNATVERYSVQYMRAIASAGGIATAAKRRRRLYDDGVSLAASLG
jgi:hypothetical protein